MNSAALRIAAIVCLSLLPSLVQAETRYVTDRVLVAMRAKPDAASPVIAELPTGTPVEVVGSAGALTQVVDAAQRRGWVDTELLSTELPALATLLRLRDERARTRAELERLRQARSSASFWAMAITAVGALMMGFGLGVLWLDRRHRVR